MSIERIINVAFQVYDWLIFIRIILSFIRHNPYHPLIRFIYEVTEPVLGFFRRFIPAVGMLDFSPLVAFFVLELLRQLILNVLRMVGL
ncbi:YggT family protein [Desulfofundulus thermobenzoicus]|uniref:YggT family protein n=1 Tax=Desulfofundulus thermobenzoicus TaxID=29376 RepID=A0A6N7IVJ1_9FIRM|nr:YggT family protein [Desulfofundulus thermobenzoicus]MQL53158.1 YggT family protein [Desulfofundulus thermobenzoicus]HHW44797.1 YggT family protein [Desulfotomaculum sp.]